MMVLSNTILAHLRQSVDLKEKQDTNDSKVSDQPAQVELSIYFYISIGFLLVNPLFHASVVSSEPCAPQFLSSLVANCTQGRKEISPLYAVIFSCIEFYGVTVMLYCWSFNWNVIFLGLAWIFMELKKIR